MPIPEDAWRDALAAFGRKPTRNDFLKAPFVQLFNVAKDPHEDLNLASQYPKRVDSMVGLLKKQIAQGRSTPGPKLANGKNVKLHQRLPESVLQVLNNQ